MAVGRDGRVLLGLPETLQGIDDYVVPAAVEARSDQVEDVALQMLA
jgi:hypothetical protein